MSFMGPIIARPRDDLYAVLRRLGLTSGLHLCLDAGSEVSAPTSATKWADLTGNGNGFYRGTSSGSDSADPAFVGTVGRRDKDTYWTTVGVDKFTFEKAVTAELRDAHHNNKSWSFLAWLQIGSPAAIVSLFSTYDSGPERGVIIGLNLSSLLTVSIFNGGSPTYIDSSFSSTTFTPGVWVMVGVAASIASGVLTMTIRVNARREANLAPTTTGSPSSTNGDAPDYGLSPDNSRFNSLAWWSGVRLSLEQYDAIFHATRSKFGV